MSCFCFSRRKQKSPKIEHQHSASPNAQIMSSSIYHNGSGCDTALQILLDSLDQVCEKVDTPVEDHLFLSQLLQNKNLQSLITVHNKINSQNVQPSYQDVSRLAKDVKELLKVSKSPESIELQVLLDKPHLKALFQTHDQVARKDFLPALPDVPFEVDEDDESVKVVQLIKNTEPLGATIKIDEASDAVVVSRIVRGSVADRSGLINVGDELREVNGIRVKGKSPLDILAILEQCREGTITFKLVPGVPPKHAPSDQVRANFCYDPMLDPLNPKPESGLAYRRGDILHIVSRQDPDWWQAHLDNDSRIGIIPSPDVQKRRLSTFQNGSLCKRSELNSNDYFDPDAKDIQVYEEVALLHPVPGTYRPIVLIGAPGVGRNELKQRLISYDPVHYKTTIPHTSRPPKSWEEEGKEYYFVSREEMEEGIREGKFVEYGEYRGNLYGTSIESVFTIVRSGRVCILNPHPQALKLLRTAELKPYVIFVKPPPFELLKETRNSAQSSFDENYSRGFTDRELQDIIDNSWNIERVYGHRFNSTIVNEDINKSFKELLTVVKKVENEPQWAPATWVLTP
ncbi:LOW QUALITY PROTEIN: MAGUK p55 subfamily member 7-like [Stegodyphus dumicola]|uniref:LOW QUALITY PROTEIN: MAGUK p55 subfamily member 7-like n=1 Tax=Stegodyphus dumicola TaxID=202533 RepID=UPI0015AC8481|nr:LOW QUALITY PROTEIN: MAGUK p55 subfamily member 7-like [Stegodyphus dumicola]